MKKNSETEEQTEEVPTIVMQFWDYKNPGVEMSNIRVLNKDFDDSDKWGDILVYKCEDKDGKALYVGLQPNDTGIMTRELDENEINFLLFGTIPPDPNENTKSIS